MGVTAKAKAPSDDAEYNAAVAFLESQQAELADLETKAGYANATAVKLAGEMERMVLQADKLSQSTGLGRTADLSGNKSFLDAHKARWTKVDADLKELKAELSAMKKHVQERHNAGAEMKKLVTKADGLEAKSDPKADVARAEADRATEAYEKLHSSSLDEINAYKSNAGSRFTVLYDGIVGLCAAQYQ